MRFKPTVPLPFAAMVTLVTVGVPTLPAVATWKSEAWTPVTAVLKVVQLTLARSSASCTRGGTVSLLVVPVLAADVLVPVLVGNSTVALIVMLLVPSLSAEASIPLIVTLVLLSAGIVGD